VPTVISYPDILNVREFSYVESAVPFMNSNANPVFFELVSIKKDDVVLDASYLSSVSILSSSVIESEVIEANNPTNSWIVYTNDLSKMGQIIIADGNPFGNGDYYFTIKASIVVGSEWESTIFEDVLHLQVGPQLVEGIAYCPFNMNFVSGESTASEPAELFGGNPDVRYELGSESDKLTIDAVTGALSLNSSYAVSETEYVYPVINVISNASEEIVSFEEKFTAVLSTTPIDLVKENNYIFYPTLKPLNADIPRAGGNGYSVETSDFIDKPGWVQKHFYKEIPGAKQLNFQEVLDTRTEAEVAGIKGLAFFYWGPLKNPFETWMIANPVNLSEYAGCFDTKIVFWVKQNIPQNILDDVFPGQTETPVNIEIKISTNYAGDVTTPDTWMPINDLLTCKIGESGDEFVGTPYPLSGEVGPEGNANNVWVKCEMDLDDYRDASSFTIAFRTKTNYDSDLSSNLRGELYISDLHFVASEK